MASAYSTGAASSFSDLLTAVEAFLTGTAGWAVTAGTGVNRLFSKGDLFVRLGYNSNQFYLFGGTGISGSALTSESNPGVNLGSASAAPMTFPITYEIHWNNTPEEIYLVVNYNGDKYQHLNWGESDIAGIGGTGLWFSGQYLTTMSLTGAVNTTLDGARMYMGSTRNTSGTQIPGGSGWVVTQPFAGMHGAFFLADESSFNPAGGIHCALEGAAAWRQTWSGTIVAGMLRSQQFGSLPMMMALPSLFNESEVLLPIHIIMQRSSSLMTIVASMRHARLMRLDNVSVGDIIIYGSDKWKCYPLYSKNTVARNGVVWTTGAYHSGTVGIALRYYGP